MQADASRGIAADGIDGGDDLDRRDLDARLLADLADRRLEDSLAGVLRAARDAPLPETRSLDRAHQQHVFAAEDDGADPDPGPIRVFAGVTGIYALTPV